MVRIYDPSPTQERAWAKWVASRPEPVRSIAQRFDPWTLYRMKSTGQRVTMASIFENGTVSVNITGEHNLIAFDRNVFGIDPNDLTPCDLPEPSEPVGTVMSHEEVEENIDALRVAIRPDLFVMGEDGKAIRKN